MHVSQELNGPRNQEVIRTCRFGIVYKYQLPRSDRLLFQRLEMRRLLNLRRQDYAEMTITLTILCKRSQYVGYWRGVAGDNRLVDYMFRRMQETQTLTRVESLRPELLQGERVAVRLKICTGDIEASSTRVIFIEEALRIPVNSQ